MRRLALIALMASLTACTAGQALTLAEIASVADDRAAVALAPVKDQLAEMPAETELGLEEWAGIVGTTVAGMFGLHQIRNGTRRISTRPTSRIASIASGPTWATGRSRAPTPIGSGRTR